MRIPYIVGRWVRGQDHYGRRRLLDYILDVEEPAIWVVGTRRMGKTSLLRQLELETDDTTRGLVPLFWDLQGCESFDDLAYELFLALEDAAHRFLELGVDIDALEGRDVLAILRQLNRTLDAQGKRLFLLIDETEVLIDIGRREAKWLARLRKSLQNGRQRTVIASTKLLSELNEVGAEWNTSPFLFGFSPANLWSLSYRSAAALARQEQSKAQISVDGAVLEDILINTNRHPYLTQYLCQRLFQPDGSGGGSLRAAEEFDLTPDHLLAGFFQTDFQHLTRLERRILLTAARMTVAAEDDVIAELPEESPERIRMFIYGLDKLGYLRQPYGQIAVGNEFLRRWLQDNYTQLNESLDSSLNERNIEAMLHAGRDSELSYLHAEMTQLQQMLESMKQSVTPAQSTPHPQGAHPTATLENEIHQIHLQLRAAQREMDKIPHRRSNLVAA